jgi:hypothetical protein
MKHPRPRSMSARWSLVAASCCASLVALSCNEEVPPPQPARFNRPNRVDFVCVNGTQVIPRAQCASDDAGSPLSLHALVTQAGRGEIAVVNLRTRTVIDSRRDIPGYTFIPVGEMPTAIVIPPENPQHTYVANFGSRDVRVLRTRALVAPLDEPVDAQRVALTTDSGVTLLAPTDMVLAPDESALFVAVPDASLVLRLPFVRCDAASEPGCEDGLIDEAAITQIELPTVFDRPPVQVEPSTASQYDKLCEFRPSEPPTTTPIDLDALDESVRTAAPRPTALALDAFCRDGESCSQRLLVADAAQPVIHVIDLDAAARGEDPLLAPIVTGVPTKDVVVTPRVPRDTAVDSSDETQYVYAVDEGDGSVLVIENGQVLNVSATPGLRRDRLVFNGGKDGALALEVMTPHFDVRGPAAQYVRGQTETVPAIIDPLACTDADHEEQNPARLRGVFLAAALTDGTIRVIDVHDMELSAPEGETPCRACAQSVSGSPPDLEPTQIPILVRNQERLAASFVALEGEPEPSFVPLASLTFGVDGVGFGVRSDGTTASPRTPDLACMRCDDALTRAWPVEDVAQPGGSDAGTDAGADAAADAGPDSGTDAGPDASADAGADAGAGTGDGGLPPASEGCTESEDALLCVANDPWSSGEDRWRAIYEGVLPTAIENRGSFVLPDDPDNKTGGLELLSDSDSCAAGVLGEEDVAADYAEGCDVPADPAGDQVVITSRPLDRDYLAQLDRGDEDTLELCAALQNELAANPRLRVAFEIRRAFRDRLVVREVMIRAIGDAKRFADIRACYEDTISFSVNSQDAFTVWGAESGFQHRVRANPVGRCQVDPAGDPLRVGRARLGCEFRNHSLQFRLGPAPPGDRVQLIGVELAVSFTSRASKLVMRAYDLGFGNASVVAQQLRYSDVDGRLYLVDINERGLLPIPLDPFPPALSTAAQFN